MIGVEGIKFITKDDGFYLVTWYEVKIGEEYVQVKIDSFCTKEESKLIWDVHCDDFSSEDEILVVVHSIMEKYWDQIVEEYNIWKQSDSEERDKLFYQKFSVELYKDLN